MKYSWDRIGKRPVVTLCTTTEGYAALKEDSENKIMPWNKAVFQVETALKNILGNEITVRFAEDTASKEPITDPTEPGLNNCFFKTEKTITHDELRFRSPPEIAIYDELKRRPLLFFPNCAAVLGGAKAEKREPDFLICDKGHWGILEVMGETYHTNLNAVKDHDRARLFKDHALLCIEFYPAQRCTSDPKAVVDAFLAILAKH